MRTKLALFTALATSMMLHAQTTVVLEPFASGFTNPVDIAHCGDSRMFVVERGGLIKILQSNGQALATPFLDISSTVNHTGGEQGLLGLAFHPQYAQNGFFYVYYNAGTGNGTVRLSRFSVSANPNVANAASETMLWELAKPYSNHNGGDLAFGPDGYLYFAPGDGGNGNDPGNRAQNMSLAYGKMHRINVNGALPYTIPPNNPFANANNADTLRSIFASGLRNPWRFGFDVGTGDLWIGDVGQDTKEEVDRIAAGVLSGPNFGWVCREGTVETPGVAQDFCGGAGAYAAPVVDLNQSGGWCSVIGGRVYRGVRYPSLAGRYIYTDFCHGIIWSLRPNGSAWINETLTSSGSQGFAAIAEDAANELYTVNTNTGAIAHIADPSATVKLSAKLVLEGPFNTGTGLMGDGLRSAGLVPTTEPYTTSLGYAVVASGGGEVTTSAVLNVTGNNAVVDWVRVELRTTAQPTVVVASAQGLLQRDGDVVATDGSSPLSFRTGAGSYHVAVRHRNHFGAMTASGVALSSTAATVDFRTSATLTYGTGARKTIGSTMALWAGNVLVDTSLRYVGSGNDRDLILVRVGGIVPTATTTGYHLEDVNMDGLVIYVGASNDRDPILVNIGGTAPTSVLDQQLP